MLSASFRDILLPSENRTAAQRCRFGSLRCDCRLQLEMALTMIASAGLAAPLDLSKMPGYSQLSPKLTSLPLVRMTKAPWNLADGWNFSGRREWNRGR